MRRFSTTFNIHPKQNKASGECNALQNVIGFRLIARSGLKKNRPFGLFRAIKKINRTDVQKTLSLFSV